MGMTESDYMSSYEAACRQAELLSAYQAALTLPDGTVMGPEEVAELRARCEAAELVIEDTLGCWDSADDLREGLIEAYNALRSPQEGAE